MYIQLTMRLILALVLSQGAHPVRADIADVGHYSQTLVDSILDIYAGNGSNRRSATVDLDDSEEDFETTPIVPTYIYPYLLLALWVACISRLHHLLLFILQVPAGGQHDGLQLQLL
ncbi:uncharacterized protein Dvir_GJ20861, isoform B [Drosophila virilis]|uniref:Uncharacterized protein, isoform B n=1 Tax=Drosophila virilis TaxID=7244 RepID=A0A0Q9WEG9_DROVI|nr:uncharacterized protein Dvir_GJ20861, isoform B [Drosophila virilis]